MKRLIYQVCLGEARNSRLYEACIASAKRYAERINCDHYVLTQAKLRIKPDPFSTDRSQDSFQKHGGFLPIYEKENAFDLLGEYDQILILDADIYVREDAPCIFKELGSEYDMGAVVEREMRIQDWYKNKIANYSHMQYSMLSRKVNFRQNELGFEFFNMGMILLNQSFQKHLNGQTAKQFLGRLEFKDFVDGKGPWKWSTDQTLLNWFVKRYQVPVKHLDDVWNGLYTANSQIDKCHFVHFFLKDKLPDRGENVEKLLEEINEKL